MACHMGDKAAEDKIVEGMAEAGKAGGGAAKGQHGSRS